MRQTKRENVTHSWGRRNISRERTRKPEKDQIVDVWDRQFSLTMIKSGRQCGQHVWTQREFQQKQKQQKKEMLDICKNYITEIKNSFTKHNSIMEIIKEKNELIWRHVKDSNIKKINVHTKGTVSEICRTLSRVMTYI